MRLSERSEPFDERRPPGHDMRCAAWAQLRIHQRPVQLAPGTPAQHLRTRHVSLRQLEAQGPERQLLDIRLGQSQTASKATWPSQMSL